MADAGSAATRTATWEGGPEQVTVEMAPSGCWLTPVPIFPLQLWAAAMSRAFYASDYSHQACLWRLALGARVGLPESAPRYLHPLAACTQLFVYELAPVWVRPYSLLRSWADMEMNATALVARLPPQTAATASRDLARSLEVTAALDALLRPWALMPRSNAVMRWVDILRNSLRPKQHSRAPAPPLTSDLRSKKVFYQDIFEGHDAAATEGLPRLCAWLRSPDPGHWLALLWGGSSRGDLGVDDLSAAAPNGLPPIGSSFKVMSRALAGGVRIRRWRLPVALPGRGPLALVGAMLHILLRGEPGNVHLVGERLEDEAATDIGRRLRVRELPLKIACMRCGVLAQTLGGLEDVEREGREDRGLSAADTDEYFWGYLEERLLGLIV